MIVINGKQFTRLMTPISSIEGASDFNKALVDTYGIKEMKAHEITLFSDWDVYFIDDNAELIFKLKYSEYL